MNAEVYFIDEANNLIDDNIKSSYVDSMIEMFDPIDINLIYKTTVVPTRNKIEQAFRETKRTSENIDIVICIGGLYGNQDCIIKKFFNNYQIDFTLSNRKMIKAEVLYSEEGIIPGYIVKFWGMDVYLLPYLRNETLNLIKKYMIPNLLIRRVLNE